MTAGNPRGTGSTLDGAAVAFGLAACIVIVFSTVLAWIEDAYDPLGNAMAALTGSRWITHGLADVILFLVIGLGAGRLGAIANGTTLIRAVAGTTVAAATGLALWFAIV